MSDWVCYELSKYLTGLTVQQFYNVQITFGGERDMNNPNILKLSFFTIPFLRNVFHCTLPSRK